MRVPNLFTKTEEAQRLYSVMLGRLEIHDRHADVVKVARKIRRHARSSLDVQAGLFTYSYERTALWHLGHYSACWIQHLRFETGWYGLPIDLRNESIESSVRYQAAEKRAPLHYACERFLAAADCQELVLALQLRRLKSDEFFYDVTNRDQIPTHPARVTLRHIYYGLQKSLTEWADWNEFVSGLSQPLLRHARVSRKLLKADPDQLGAIDAAIVQRRNSKRNRRPIPRNRKSPWEEELLRWFPFLQEFPRT